MSRKPRSSLAALLAQKFPGRSKPNRKAPAWMPPDLAAVYTQIPAGSVIAPFHGRILSPAGCQSRKALMNSVDRRGEWFGATWMPFTEDASGGMLCFDTKSGRFVYCDAPSAGAPPKLVARSVAAWLEATMTALAKVPDPPDPDDDDYLEEEQEARFVEKLRVALLKHAKAAPKPKPRADVPPAPPPPDEGIPKAIQFIATFEETKKHALDGLYIAKGIGTVLGKTKLSSIGMPGYGGRWPKSMWKVVFHHGRDDRHQGLAGIALLDAKSLEAFVMFDDTNEAPVFVKDVDRILKKLGFLIDVIDDAPHRKRVAKKFQRYLDG